MTPKFEIGHSVFIQRRREYDAAYGKPFNPWREGTVTAIGEDAIRVRTVTHLPWGKVRWIPTNHPQWLVCAVVD